MGGKALKNTYTERKSIDYFNRIDSELIPVFKKALDTDVRVIKSYHSKSDFGDIDLMIKIKPNQINILEFVKETFKPNEIISNGYTISFDYDSFQVDLNMIRENSWDVACIYFDYDPTGNLMGKTAHKFYCKYGDKGLIYRYNSGRISENIVLSTDNREIFTFLGYDYDRFLEGFENLEDIFEFVVDSKYFDYTDMLMENLNHIDRKRNSKRVSYQKFLSYLTDNDIKKSIKIDRDNNINLINEFFPNININERIKELEIEESNQNIIREKFNGRLILDLYPNLSGQEIGKAIMDFKMGMEDFSNYVLNNTSEKIMEDFVYFYEK
jgi:hypothetical protein